MGTAVSTDTETHDGNIETALGILCPIAIANTYYQDRIALVINKGKGGNLTGAQMAAAITNVTAGMP